MCSKPGARPAAEGPAELTRIGQLGQAIDELADAAGVPDASPRDVAQRLARLWDMVADLDPELARRLAGYGS
jgi:hypothetical protein